MILKLKLFQNSNDSKVWIILKFELFDAEFESF